jgi:hypothetical protein
MAANTLFQPNDQSTVSISTTTVSQTVALVVNTGSRTSFSLRIKNIDASNVAYVRFGAASIAATVPSGGTGGSMPIGAGETVGITIPGNTTNVAAVTSTGTATVYFTPGEGL